MRYNREKKELTFDEAKDKALRLLEFRSHSDAPSAPSQRG